MLLGGFAGGQGPFGGQNPFGGQGPFGNMNADDIFKSFFGQFSQGGGFGFEDARTAQVGHFFLLSEIIYHCVQV